MQKLKNDTYDLFDSEPRWYRSLFWPVIILFVIAGFLIAQVGIITSDHLTMMIRFAPILLIGAGIDLIVTRQSPIMGALLAVITMGALIAFAVFGFGTNWGNPPELIREEINLLNDGYTTYAVTLDGGISELRVAGGDDANTLIGGQISHYSQLNVDSSINDDNQVAYHIGVDSTFFLPNFLNNQVPTTWDLELSPELPLSLNVDGGVGAMTLNLAPLNLTDLKVNVGVGAVTIYLPDTRNNYHVDIDGGIGETILNLPANTAVRLEASAGVGNLSIEGLERVTEPGDSLIGDEGVWESVGFNDAEVQITIQFDGGIGQLIVR